MALAWELLDQHASTPVARRLQLTIALYHFIPGGENPETIEPLAREWFSLLDDEQLNTPLTHCYAAGLAWCLNQPQWLNEHSWPTLDPACENWQRMLQQALIDAWTSLATGDHDTAEKIISSTRRKQAKYEQSWLKDAADHAVQQHRAMTCLSLYLHLSAVERLIADQPHTALDQLAQAREAAQITGDVDMENFTCSLGGFVAARNQLEAW